MEKPHRLSAARLSPPDAFYPVAVIGAGPAGSAAAAALARQGYRVALFDRDVFPRDKLCGEFLSGESHRLLAELGCLDGILAARPPEIDRMEFTSADGARVAVRLPAPALGVSRRTLDTVLLDNARRAGVEVFEDTEVENLRLAADGAELDLRLSSGGGARLPGRIRASLVIGAHGRSSRLDRSLGRLPVDQRFPAYVGFKRHHFPADGVGCPALDRHGEVHVFQDGYCGIAPVEGGRVNVCLLVRLGAVKEIAPHGRWDEIASALARRSPALAARLASLTPCPDRPMLAAAPVTFRPKGKASGPVLFAGDSAGMIAPLCGDGQAMALESGLRLAGLIGTVPETELAGRAADLGVAWTRAWGRDFRRRMHLGQMVQRLLLAPRIAGAAVRLFAAVPSAAHALARATRGR